MATIPTPSAPCTLNPCIIAAPEHAHGVFTYPLNNDSHPSKEVLSFIQRRLKSEREELASEREYLTRSSGLMVEFTELTIALLENDIVFSDQLLQDLRGGYRHG